VSGRSQINLEGSESATVRTHPRHGPEGAFYRPSHTDGRTEQAAAEPRGRASGVATICGARAVGATPGVGGHGGVRGTCTGLVLVLDYYSLLFSTLPSPLAARSVTAPGVPTTRQQVRPHVWAVVIPCGGAVHVAPGSFFFVLLLRSLLSSRRQSSLSYPYVYSARISAPKA
jgi:hypothetical protein